MRARGRREEIKPSPAGRTIRVVGVDVGVGGVPALDGAVHAATEALLAARAHGDAQHGAAARGAQASWRRRAQASARSFEGRFLTALKT